MTKRGSIPRVDPRHPDAWGKCDRTGLPTMHSDLIKQYEYIGNTLRWTGLMVNKRDCDQPNPQLIAPRLIPDPIPVKNPRYFSLIQMPSVPTGLTLLSATSQELNIQWNAVPEATNYAVQWKYPNGLVFSTLPLQDKNDETETHFTISELSKNTSYTVSIASINNVGYQILSFGNSLYLSYNLSSWSPALLMKTEI